MSKFNEKRFKFSETFVNTSGKTSGSGFIGVILGLVSALVIIATMFGYFFKIPNTVEVMEIMLKLVGLSALLLGVRKLSPVLGKFGGQPPTKEERQYEDAPYEKTSREQAEINRDIKQDVIDAEKG